MGRAGHGLPARLGLAGPAGDVGSPIHRLDPRAKLAGFLVVIVIALATPVTAWPVWLGCLAVLATIAALARLPPGLVARRAGVVLPVVLLAAAAIPLTHADGPRAGFLLLAAVAAKATIGTLAAVVLGATTGFPAILAAFEDLRAPRLLTLIAGLMWRYLAVIGADLARMRDALAARGYRPRHALASAATGRLATALFLRTHARGERVQLAMSARGFDGRMPRLAERRLARADTVFVVAIAVALVPQWLVMVAPVA